jgi:hypothetical protein
MYSITFTASGVTKLTVEKRSQARIVQQALLTSGAVVTVDRSETVDLTPKPLSDAQKQQRKDAASKRKKTGKK